MKKLLLLLLFIPCLSFGQWTYGTYRDITSNIPYSRADNKNLNLDVEYYNLMQYSDISLSLYDSIGFVSHNFKMIIIKGDSIIIFDITPVVDSNFIFISRKLVEEKYFQDFKKSNILIIQALNNDCFLYKEYIFDMSNIKETIDYLTQNKTK